MKLKKEQVKEIKNEIGEKRFNEIVTPELVYNCNKIYLKKEGVDNFKLQRIHKTDWKRLFAWVDLDVSDTFANSIHETPELALKSKEGYEVFNSIKQAIESGFFD
jgi:hypothetical protein